VVRSSAASDVYKRQSINNPKIALSLIEKEGELVYPKQN
jgi:hypothetical protein